MSELPGLRICFIAGTLGQGGAERQLYYIVQALTQAGASIRVLSLTRGEYWERRIRDAGVEVCWVGQSGSRALRLAEICSAVRRWQPHVVQSQHFFTNLYAAGAARLSGAIEIGAIRSNVEFEMRNNGRVLGALSLRVPRLLACNSKAALAAAAARGVAPDRLRLLPNVVDVQRFHPAPALEDDPVRILAVGRMTHEKRYDRFLEVVATVRARSRQNVVATIVGAGPLRSTVEHLANDLGLLPDGIEFLGAQEDTAPVYRGSHVFLLTSDVEGCPNVVLEAMASGLPVVATRVGGVPEIVEDRTSGLLTDRDDVDGLIAAVHEMVENPSLRRVLSENARASVERRFCPESLAATLQELYASALRPQLIPARA
jgi:glycosyltransferase involved in cell wall biosynthesis